MTKSIFCFTGYPASGKSTACEIAAESGAQSFVMGDIVRENASEVLGGNPTSDEIGEWATTEREEHGDDVFAEYTADAVAQTDSNTVVIDGLRSSEEAAVFRNRFGEDNVSVIFVHAPFETRFKRIVERGREGEEEFTTADLEARDEREETWGLDELVATEDYDVYISNDGAFEDFSSDVTNIIPQPTKAANAEAP